MSNPVTIVTCFFDIGRAEKGDGRTISEYKDWIQKTLQYHRLPIERKAEA